MAGQTAIIAGQGALPVLLGRGLAGLGAPFVVAQMADFPFDNPDGWPVETFRVETLAHLFDRLRALGVDRVSFAGAVRRPAIDPARIDPDTARLLPRLLPAFGQGDDALLRAVIALFEEAGFAVLGAHDLLPGLLPGPGVLTRAQPDAGAQADAARAADIVATLGAADLGQGAVVAGGLCLAVETLPGTDAMLHWVADVAGKFRRDGSGGVLFKAAKPGQDRRIDLPVIGPDTVAACTRAGLSGIAFQAGSVMLLDRAATIAAADAAGLFLWAR